MDDKLPDENPKNLESETEQNMNEFRKVGSNSSSFDSNILQPQQNTSRAKFWLAIVGIVIALLIILALVFRTQVKNLVGGGSKPSSTPAPVEASPTPEPTPLVRAEWSLEVLNGSGVSGLAKKVADQLSEMGYPIVKTGNADKSNYEQSQILVQKDLQEKVDLVAADIKDIIKIASMGGQLKDSTASARIIIGKDAQ